MDAPSLPFDFTGGYVGYFGYELKSDGGSRNAHRAETPDAAWIFPGHLLVVDHEENTTYLLALSDGSPGRTPPRRTGPADSEGELASLPGKDDPGAAASIDQGPRPGQPRRRPVWSAG